MRRPTQEAPFVKRRRERLNSSNARETIEKSMMHIFVDWLNDWHVTRLFQAAGSFLLILTLVGFYFDYQGRQQSRIVDAWQLITTKAPGNSGKKEALEYLNSIRQPLTGIDLSTNKKNWESGVYLMWANLPRVFFSQAKLDNANLSFANLERALLSSANLNEANLTGTNLTSANLKRANLINANLLNAQLKNADLSNANLLGAMLSNADLKNADLKNANLEGANLLVASLTNANLTNSNLTSTNLLDTDLTNANLRNANLTNVDLTIVDLTGAKGLTCEQLIKANNWQLAYRDKQLSCGADIPIKPEN